VEPNRIGGCHNCEGEGCPIEERDIVSTGAVKDRSLLRIGKSDGFLGGRGNFFFRYGL
jgi:hypothetical protein